jgi:hypothetical protein
VIPNVNFPHVTSCGFSEVNPIDHIVVGCARLLGTVIHLNTLHVFPNARYSDRSGVV